MASRRLRGTLVVVILTVAVALTGCGSGEQRRVAVALAAAATPAGPAVSLEITPATGAVGLPASTEIGITLANGTIGEVTLADAAGTRISGMMRENGTSWVPDISLNYGATYTATATATGNNGTTATRTTTFTTMARLPQNDRVFSSLYLADGKTYGVGMPVVVEFDEDIPEAARAAVQQRLFVRSNPEQPGAWRWFNSRTIMYRPQTFWKTGTTLTIRTAIGGLPIGSHIGDSDDTATVTIGRDLRIEIDNATKQMTVTQEGAVVKTFPVSLGKPSTPSSSGITVIMSREASTIFDTTRTDGANGYRVQVSYAERLTWGGEYIHAAPWSEGDQGYRNVSHGCINLSTSNAAWVYNSTLIGDPVTTKGTEVKLTPGNGWTIWDMTWAEYTSAATP